jgi:exodeoxyribonuclease VII large subunit
MNCYTVSQLGLIAKSLLSETFNEDTWVTGEIHGYKMHDRSGHVYFDLVEKDGKDSGKYIAKIGCAFFKNSLLSWHTKLRRDGFSSFKLADGLEIKLRAGVDLYVKEGRYQLIVSEIDAGYTLGAIARKRQQTIDELKKAGLFEKNRQLEIIDCPLKIGLITSVGSAAYNDFLSVLNSSGYAFKLNIFNAYMQGERTPYDVSMGIKALEQKDIDVIAIVRGGGAKTDLFYFDDIRICQAVARCRLPVLTGIGHEIDLSVADMVAYRSFVTPTDTARFLSSMLDSCWQRLADALISIESCSGMLQGRANDQLKMLAYRLSVSVSKITMAADSTLHVITKNLGIEASRASSYAESRLSMLEHTLSPAARTIITSSSVKLNEFEKLVRAIDPLSTMKRGFSITLGSNGNPIMSVNDTEKGDILKTILYQGRLTSTVESKELL